MGDEHNVVRAPSDRKDDEPLYTALGPGQIRLLSLDGRSANSFDLSTFALEDAPDYNCLSYEWGDAEPKHQVKVNRRTVYIRENLFNFLAEYQKIPGEERYIWIDQMCINQENEVEKSAQVQFMGEIFAKASKVLAWVGMEDEHSQNLRHLVQERRSVADGHYEWENIVDKANILKIIDTVHSSVRHFFQRSYWYRMWTLQEQYLAKHLIFICGSWHIRFEDLTFLSLGAGIHLEPIAVLSELRGRQLSTLFDLLERLYVEGYVLPLVLDVSQPQDRRLGNQWRCTRLEDRIYGVLGLLPAHERVTVDYGISLQQLVDNVVNKAMAKRVEVRMDEVSLEDREHIDEHMRKEEADFRRHVCKLLEFDYESDS